MKRSRFGLLKKIFYLALSLAAAGLLLLALAFIYYSGQVPDPGAIGTRQISESTKIYDRTGAALLYDIHGEEKRTIIPWEQIPEAVKKATLASEDSGFYEHRGVDFGGILRAVYRDITSLSASQGGSTITQQLVKLSLLGKEKTLARKIKEAALSLQVEKRFSKDQIFWMYLNQIPYGSNAYGIEAASQTFFGKPAGRLSVAEAALLAALPKAPSYYSPYGSRQQELLGRRDYVLGRMNALGYIDEDTYRAALAERPEFQPPSEGIRAPHFVIMVREYLIAKYGEETVESGGLNVITTLDAKLQETAEELVAKYGKINAEKYQAGNAALTALDPRSGQVLALVGSRDYFDVASEGNFNVALASRQPGSAFKPFAYARLLEKGFPDTAVLFDLKTEFNPGCDPSGDQVKDSFGLDCYHPQNYDGTFRGPVTARQALAQSLNLPSVKVLYLAGLDDTIDLAHKLGITTLNDRQRYGLSLVLGGGEVRLVDMVSAYGVFANDGVRVAPGFILKVTGADGTVLEEYKKDDTRVLDPQIARMVSDILSDNRARSPVFGFNSSLYFPGRPVAAKTGTTQENRDGWLIGYTPALVVGVWTGNNNNDSMTKQGAGISAAGPLWHEFMARALADASVEEFIKPNPLAIDKPMLNGDYNGPDGIHTILYYINKNEPAGDGPSDPTGDPQFKNWEAAVQRWLAGPL
ncbi:MAG: PBP1A family penicillin-binding protein [Patescibacteria group bacterium]